MGGWLRRNGGNCDRRLGRSVIGSRLLVLVIPVINLKSCLIFILFLHSNVAKSYREIKAREPVYFNNLFLHFYNK